MKIPVAGLDLGAINGVKDMGCSFLMGRLCAAGGSGNVSRKVLVERPDLLASPWCMPHHALDNSIIRRWTRPDRDRRLAGARAHLGRQQATPPPDPPFHRRQRARYGCEAAFLAGSCIAFGNSSRTKICRQTGLINSMVWRFPSPVGFATKRGSAQGSVSSPARRVPAVLATVSRQRVLYLPDNRSQDLNALLDLPNAQGGIAHDKPHAIDVAFVRLPLVKGRDQV